MKKILSIIIFVMLFVSAVAIPNVNGATSDDVNVAVVSHKERGLIDWTNNYIETNGMAIAPQGMTGAQAKAMAKRGAIVDLQRNMLEFLAGVSVNGRTTMNDYMAEDRVRSEVHGMIQNLELLDGNWDGESYTVNGRIRLPELLVCVVPNLPKTSAQTQPQSMPKTSGRFTGLVIDARHLSIKPTLSFRVVDESGRVVYGVGFADQKFLAQSGLATYYNNLNYAKDELRVAANPITTKAVRLTSDSSDIVIPNSAAAKIRGSSYDFRKECKVIIVCK